MSLLSLLSPFQHLLTDNQPIKKLQKWTRINQMIDIFVTFLQLACHFSTLRLLQELEAIG